LAPPNFTAVAGISCQSLDVCVTVGHTASGATKSATAVLQDPSSTSGQWTSTPTPAVSPSTK
jgi:hypothetical protein